MTEFTGIRTIKDLPTGDGRKNEILRPIHYEDWYAFGNLIQFILGRKFDWIVEISSNRVHTYDYQKGE